MVGKHTVTRAKKLKKASGAKAHRVDVRLNADQTLLIQSAADLEGRTMTDFVIHSAETAARRTIQERSVLILSVRETEMFVDAILSPSGPGPVLRAAARHYEHSPPTVICRP